MTILNGIDVSHWQGDIDHDEVKASGQVDFVYVRTGDGKDRDRKAVENLRGFKRVGILVGVYHYFRAEHGYRKNFDVMDEAIDDAEIELDLAPACDLEGHPSFRGKPASGAWQDVRSDVELNTRKVACEVANFLLACEEEYGGFCLYTGRAWLDTNIGEEWDRIDYEPHTDEIPLWLAVGAGGKVPETWKDRGWTIRQTTARGMIPGIDGTVDLNVSAEEKLAALRPAKASHVAQLPGSYHLHEAIGRLTDIQGQIAETLRLLKGEA